MTSSADRSPSQRGELIVLAGAKVSANTAQRWVGPFLPTLERAFSASTGTLTGIIGVCEFGGLSTAASGRSLDRGHEHRITIAALIAIVASSLIALVGTVEAFAISFFLVILGVTNLTVAGHAWIGRRVPFAARGRAIGSYEISWALSLLVGAPILALLIDGFGWRGPYVALAIACGVSAAVVALRVSRPPTRTTGRSSTSSASLPRTAWFALVGSAMTAASGIGAFVISGAWLDDAHGLSTGGLGTIAAAFGVVELVSSSSVAAFGDRVGIRRSVLGGLALLGVGAVVILLADGGAVAGIAGLLLLITGFELAFVSTLTLVTEAAPDARGKAIGLGNAVGTIARGTAVIASGQLYEAYGMTGSLTLIGSCAIVAFALILNVPTSER